MQKKSPLTRRKKEYRRDKEKSPLIIAKMERSNAVHLGKEKNPFFFKGGKICFNSSTLSETKKTYQLVIHFDAERMNHNAKLHTQHSRMKLAK